MSELIAIQLFATIAIWCGTPPPPGGLDQRKQVDACRLKISKCMGESHMDLGKCLADANLAKP